MVTEKDAVELLDTFRILISRVRRTRIFHFILGLFVLATAISFLALHPHGRPMANEVLILCGLIFLGAFAFIAKRFAELGNRLRFKRETESVIEEILKGGPQLRSKFNRDVVISVFENSLYE